MKNRWIIALALAAAPSVAAAQFTTFIAPPNPVKDSIKAVVAAEQKAAADSITRTQISDMKTWVDSAAGIAVPSSDSVYRVNTITGNTEVATGMVAPNTASPLPFVLAIGAATMLLGLALLRRRKPEPKRVNSRR